MKEQYKEFSFQKSTLKLIDVMNQIIIEYTKQGFKLTVRQLYYQLVARGFIENTERSYKKTTSTVNDARLAGLMDWDAIEDRTRGLIERSHWGSGKSIIQSAARSFFMSMWETQDIQPLVIVEKEALAGVLEQACYKWDVPLLPARGYPSGTVLREIVEQFGTSKPIHIFHFGDHDPSGIDMTRDLRERLEMFSRSDMDIELIRIALNMDQVEELNPPPNPAKTTDTRFADYRRKYGEESWELDALQPTYLTQLVDQSIEPLIDFNNWDDRKDEIAQVKAKIFKLAENFDKE